MLSTLLEGLILGLSIAAPVGPIGILCVRRTLALGRWIGLVSGLGAATADGFYGCIAGFGLTAIADFLTNQSMGLRIVGGLFLGYLGIKTFLTKPSLEISSTAVDGQGAELAVVGEKSAVPRSLLTAYGSTLALTLTNPATILSFAAIFAGIGIIESGQDYWTSGVLVLGVFLGSALWWLFLSGAVSLFRDRIKPTHMRWLNRLSGIILLVFSLVALTFWL
ncbi:LysE family transporter [Oscillatoria sp. CS-180]|uniref:LysE/ArgO family amino acid transporter n=1 Tax=Oscillatoria sp. CS-180 TaxID=3021720 RepID=UPI00232E98F4|nr:LysE family transporter [Oscillatoria sp. CS-180]MDB9525066.1 LysE family transporter [Oscillatoria sp. CS-180]